MAKATGLGWTTLTVDTILGNDNVDIRNDVTNLQFSTPRATTDVTGIDKMATERLLLLADFSITLSGQWNTALAHTVFKSVPTFTNQNLRTTAMTVNTANMTNEVWYTDYSITRAAGGDLNWSAPGVLGDGTVPAWT